VSLKEGLAIFKLFKLVAVGVLSDVLTQLLSLLLQMQRHFIVHVLEKTVDWGQKLTSCILERISNHILGLISEFCCALRRNQALASQVFVKTVDRAAELGK
jgi:hypothetical protein